MTDIIIRVPKSAISAAFNQGITTAAELVRIAAIRKPEHKDFLLPLAECIEQSTIPTEEP